MEKVFKAACRLCVAMVAVIAALAWPDTASAQRERNYIYIFDCTGSMKKLNLWDPAKAALDKTITRQGRIEGANFTVIPFQGKVHESFSFAGEDYGKNRDKIFGAFDKYVDILTNTNIYEAFEAGMRAVNPAMDNRVYLLTDGEDNIKGTDEVCRLIDLWCADHRNARFFYVMLDGVASNPKIDQALARCSDAYGVKCQNGVIPQIADVAPRIYANTLELDKTYRLEFSEPGTYPVSVSTDDPYFDVDVVGGHAADCAVGLRFHIRNGLSLDELNDALASATDPAGNYDFDIRVSSADKGMIIANPDVEVVMANRAQRSLSMLGGAGVSEIVLKPGAEWYPAFLWSAAAEPQRLAVDLAPQFGNIGAADAPEATLEFMPAEGQPSDFRTWYNGEELRPGDRIKVTPGSAARLEFEFNPDAATGKRYFTLAPRGVRDLETINGLPVGEFRGQPMRTSYSVGWNPLYTAFFWIGIVLLALLALWFAVLRRMVYPVFKKMTLQFEGPGAYYATKKLKGCRKAVLTSRSRSQNLLGALFTGKILYIRADHFTPEVEIVPAGKRSARVVRSASWDVTPTSRLEAGPDDYELYNNTTGEKCKITVN